VEPPAIAAANRCTSVWSHRAMTNTQKQSSTSVPQRGQSASAAKAPFVARVAAERLKCALLVVNTSAQAAALCRLAVGVEKCVAKSATLKLSGEFASSVEKRVAGIVTLTFTGAFAVPGVFVIVVRSIRSVLPMLAGSGVVSMPTAPIAATR